MVTAGTLVGSGTTSYSYKAVTFTAASGDLLVAGVGAADKGNGASTINDFVTTGGTTSAWTVGRSGGTSGSDSNGIVGLATVSTGGSITVEMRMSSSGIGSSYHMGGGVYLIPAAEWNSSGTSAVAATFFADADGKVNLTPPAGSMVFFFGWDWAASSIASNAGTPSGGNLRVRTVDTGAYSIFIADWGGQTASARDYGLLSVSGQDWAGGVVWAQEASGGTNTGTLSASTPKLTASISGQSVNAGTVNASVPRATTSITGASSNAGTTSASTPVLTSSIAGNSVNPGTLSASVPRLTTSISDTTNVTGTLTAQTPKLTASITGASVNVGTVNAQLIRLTSTVAGNSVNTGALAAYTPLATMLVAGTSKLTGTVLARTPLLTFYATDAAALVPLPFPLQLVGDAIVYGLRAEYPSLTLYGVADEFTLEG